MNLIEMGLEGEITIPKDILERLKIKDHVQISLNDNNIIIQPYQDLCSLDSIQGK